MRIFLVLFVSILAARGFVRTESSVAFPGEMVPEEMDPKGISDGDVTFAKDVKHDATKDDVRGRALWYDNDEEGYGYGGWGGDWGGDSNGWKKGKRGWGGPHNGGWGHGACKGHGKRGKCLRESHWCNKHGCWYPHKKGHADRPPWWYEKKKRGNKRGKGWQWYGYENGED